MSGVRVENHRLRHPFSARPAGNDGAVSRSRRARRANRGGGRRSSDDVRGEWRRAHRGAGGPDEQVSVGAAGGRKAWERSAGFRRRAAIRAGIEPRPRVAQAARASSGDRGLGVPPGGALTPFRGGPVELSRRPCVRRGFRRRTGIGWPARAGGAGPMSPMHRAGDAPPLHLTGRSPEARPLLRIGRSGEIRTHDPCLPKTVLYQAELHSDRGG